MKTNYFKAKCKYSGKCSQEGIMCATCKHNEGKQNYYEPIHPWIIPQPNPPFKPTVTYKYTTGRKQ